MTSDARKHFILAELDKEATEFTSARDNLDEVRGRMRQAELDFLQMIGELLAALRGEEETNPFDDNYPKGTMGYG